MDSSAGAGYLKPSRAQRLIPQQVEVAFFLVTVYPLFPMALSVIAGGLGVLRESLAGEVQNG